MTEISFERSGGFMGRTISTTINLADLPDDQAGVLKEMLDEADFFELPEDLTRPPIPDAFTYTITVNTEVRHHSVRFSDSTAPDDLRPLLDELNKQARMRQ